MTTTQLTDQIDAATYAISHMYADWEEQGGPSPSTEDEAQVVARALGLQPVTDPDTIQAIWETKQDGLTDAQVARLHVLALVAGTRPATDDEMKGL